MTYKKFELKKAEVAKGISELENEMQKPRSRESIEYEWLVKLLSYLKRLNDAMEPRGMKEDYLALEYLAEKFVCVTRDVTAILAGLPREEVILKGADTMGITVEKNNGVLEVTIPKILPTKDESKPDYLFEPLFYAMRDFHYNCESVAVAEKVMMCIEFVYGEDYDRLLRGDHDNKEVKQVIDAIANFVVPDDSDYYLSLCQISSVGKYSQTKVYVMPEKDFGEFFLKHQNK